MTHWLGCLMLATSLLIPLSQDSSAKKTSDDQDGKAKKAAKPKEPPKPGALAKKVDPIGKPEGSIVKKPARFYLYFEKDKWKLRTCAQKMRHFDGTIKVKNGTVKSVVNTGLIRDGKKKSNEGANMEEKRTKIVFHFDTSIRSDGFDFDIEGDDAEIELELRIDGKTIEKKSVFIGASEQHPPIVPFSLKAHPKKKE